MPTNVKPIPDGYHTATPCLIIRDCAKAIAFYKKAFGAIELAPPCVEPSGKIAHAELRIGDSMIMFGEENEVWKTRSPQSFGGTPVSIALYVPDVDSFFAKAVAAGAKVLQPVADQFYGDRTGRIEDPFGHVWNIATHKEDLTPEEVNRRFKEWLKKMQPA